MEIHITIITNVDHCLGIAVACFGLSSCAYMESSIVVVALNNAHTLWEKLWSQPLGSLIGFLCIVKMLWLI